METEAPITNDPAAAHFNNNSVLHEQLTVASH